MNRITVAFLFLASLTFEYANAECANACNGHGKCTSYDMCICNRNWQANDCSERVCMFGLAHVDTPKGDLDASGAVSDANKLVIDNSFVYPYGTTEQFPLMQDSDLQQIPNTAHYYMECSNKGRCDRKSGDCQCFEGYDGVACQRASCPGFPNSCSGHGVCKSIRQLASADYGNVYELWDRDTTMGCECDSGYYGPDCSERKCKYGVDPLYLDDAATVKYSIFDVATLTTKTSNDATTGTPFTNGANQKENGYFALRFNDVHGEDWMTDRISAGATCSEVTSALYGIPNNVVPENTIECTRIAFLNGIENTFSSRNQYYDAGVTKHPFRLTYKMALWDAKTSALYDEMGPTTATTQYTSSNDTSTTALSGYIYRLKFYGNPGKFRQPSVDVHLDGKLPTLISPGYKVLTKVWTDGQQGENLDYFADHCNGVSVTIGIKDIADSGVHYSFLNGLTLAEKSILKQCLGNSDFDITNNQDVYNWDYGNKMYPHLIKLVRTVTTANDGGYYAAVYYDTSVTWDNTAYEGTFRLLNPFKPPDNLLTDNYDIYTTKGVLALTSNYSEATFGFASQFIYTVNTTFDTNNTLASEYDGDISCEVKAKNSVKFEYIMHCLNRSDIFTMLNFEYPQYNPPHINMYTAKRLMQLPFAHSVKDRFRVANADMNNELHYLTNQITADLATNWGASVGPLNPNAGPSGLPKFHVYKFFPAKESTYEYVAQCSNRGICDTSAGTCKCFSGYTSDDCSEQSSLAL